MDFKVLSFRSLGSTQDKAKFLGKKGLYDIVIKTKKQTKGRGRFNRKWLSEEGSLQISFLIKPENFEKAKYLTFSAGIAVVKCINRIAKIETKIKWPNDVIYNNRKLCGILTEGVFGNKNYIVVGIGVNVNQTDFPDSIKKIAISLANIKNKKFDIENLSNAIIKEFFLMYNNYYKRDKFQKIQDLWKKYNNTIGKNIIVLTKYKKIFGKAVGIDDDCNLLLRLRNGKIIKIIEGDIKVRYSPPY